MSRGELIGKTARELFSAEAAELIERRDQQLLAQRQQLEPIIDTIDNPVRGRRVICARRIQVGGVDEESHMFVTGRGPDREAGGGGIAVGMRDGAVPQRPSDLRASIAPATFS